MKDFRKVLLSAAFILCTASLGFAATLTVSNITDVTDGICDADCSLRDAIAVANSTVDDDEIVFDAAVFGSPQTITLSGTDLMLSNNGSITISGPGATLLTINGNNTSRVITITDSTVAHISGLNVTGGNGVSTVNTGRAGGIYNAGGTVTLTNVIVSGNNAANGGGLNNASGTASTPGDLTIRNCIVSGNTATGTGGGLQNFSTSTILIENSTFSGNVSNGTSGGGGMGVNGFVTVSNSTFVGNSAPNGRGGGMQSNGSLFILTNVTITGNSAATIGGGYYRSTTNTNNFIRNTIIAGNTAPVAPDVTQATGGSIMSQGNNIIGDVGTSVGWIASDILDVDAKLSPAGNYGGFGMTVAPMNDSPAIDAGQNCVRDLSCGRK